MSNLIPAKLDFQKMINLFIVILLSFVCAVSQAQDMIRLDNPSFEDAPGCCRPPHGWRSLDFRGHTPPDVHPSGEFNVRRRAFHGSTYLGMVTRDDGTFETIYQRLSSALQPNQCYTLSVFLSKSPVYSSGTNSNPQIIDFIEPAILQILAGNHFYDPELEILNASTPVDHDEWIEYVFEFIPSEDFSYIFLSAYYPEGTEYFTNGHILLDYLSDIVPCADIED